MAHNFDWDSPNTFWRMLRTMGVPKWKYATEHAQVVPGLGFIIWGCANTSDYVSLHHTPPIWSMTMYIMGRYTCIDACFAPSHDMLARLRAFVEDPLRLL